MLPTRNSDEYNLAPNCQKKVSALLEDAKTDLPNLVIFEARRTEERQAYYFGMGRKKWQMMFAYPTKSEYWKYADPTSPTRTNTTRSLHLTGNAVDFCFDYGDGYSWKGDWVTLRYLGKKHGLESLYPYESVHLQYNPKYNLNLQLMIESETLAKELWTEADNLQKEGERLISKSVEIKNRAHQIAESARNS